MANAADTVPESYPLRLLFVDDEPHILSGLERMLHGQRAVWDMRFCTGGEAGLRALEQAPADVVISDMRMPGMTGGLFLGEVMRRWPSTMRMILSGQADRELILQTIGPAHQFLLKPCDAGTLQATIGRISRLRRAIANSQVHQLVGGMTSLPSLPSLHQQLCDELAVAHPSIERIGAVVMQDPGMAARVLQLLNSGFFGAPHTLVDPREAVARLGVDILRVLTHGVQAFTRLAVGRQTWFDPGGMWAHSVRVSRLAGLLAGDLGLGPAQVIEAQTAGLLHDAGHMLLIAHRPQEFVILARRVGHESDVHGERLVLGCTHGEIGAYFLGLWGLPETITTTVTWHHEPMRAAQREAGVLTCVHAADALLHRMESGGSVDRLSYEHLAAVGLTDRLAAWTSIIERDAETAPTG